MYHHFTECKSMIRIDAKYRKKFHRKQNNDLLPLENLTLFLTFLGFHIFCVIKSPLVEKNLLSVVCTIIVRDRLDHSKKLTFSDKLSRRYVVRPLLMPLTRHKASSRGHKTFKRTS